MNWQTRKVINKGFSDSNQIQYYEFVENNQQIHERTLRVCQHFLCPKTAKRGCEEMKFLTSFFAASLFICG